ncbi:hypothetical protein FZ103_17420 [Streptomonospora sp. PA3]|uniref:hypothetical protein n=1 Tax=Streptomonospora sp. PA3 TaxID=2607326 RepID=UPI0012DEFBB9|nr:hypothetical protein [Streptomonospora sp. PA3]MUL42925.1 hypothetical protein [Streptomonospora sp. PA3]
MRTPFLSRDRLAVAMIVALLALVAAFAATRIGGEPQAGAPRPQESGGAAAPMSALMPVSDREFRRAVEAAAEHGRLMGTFDPAGGGEAYFDRLRTTADTAYAGNLDVEGAAAFSVHRRLAEHGRPTEGRARARVAPMVSAEAVTVELALTAEAAGGGGGGEVLELGTYHVSLRRDGGDWLVMGVSDTADIDAMRGEGLI